jgi:hypothetical protein
MRPCAVVLSPFASPEGARLHVDIKPLNQAASVSSMKTLVLTICVVLAAVSAFAQQPAQQQALTHKARVELWTGVAQHQPSGEVNRIVVTT